MRLEHEIVEESLLRTKEPPAVLWHYTSINKLYHIVKHKRLISSHFKSVNDKTEFEDALLFIKKKAAADTRIQDYLDHENVLDIFSRRYIGHFISFCESGDVLSMWRAYAHSETGIAIGFSTEYIRHSVQGLTGFEDMLAPCIYSDEDKNVVFEGLLNNDELLQVGQPPVGHFIDIMLRLASYFKNKHFFEEREWRIVEMLHSGNRERYVEVEGRKQLPLNLAHNSNRKFIGIKKIILSPDSDKEMLELQIGNIFQSNNLSVPEILPSDIPYTNNRR